MTATTFAATPLPEDDDAIVRDVVAGRRGAFEALMRRYNRRLYRLARAALRDEAESEDALQDAYVQAFRSIGQFRGESSLGTWLSRLVLNECFARLRRSTRRRNIVPIATRAEVELDSIVNEQAEAPDRSAMRSEMRAILERKLDELPAALRVAFVLRSVEEMSVEEVSRLLGVPEATVRSRHFRARSLLRDALAREIDAAERDLFEFGGDRCDRVVSVVLARLQLNG